MHIIVFENSVSPECISIVVGNVVLDVVLKVDAFADELFVFLLGVVEGFLHFPHFLSLLDFPKGLHLDLQLGVFGHEEGDLIMKGLECLFIASL